MKIPRIKSRVLFMGEEITDIYCYGKLIAKAMKEPCFTFQEGPVKKFDGGVVAAANHARSFCEVDIASDRIVEKLRYVEQSHTRKLFEIYSPPRIHRIEFDAALYDCVMVLDYGHGMFDGKMIERVTREARVLAVNVQTNSQNYGFNLVTRWPRADYLCMDEAEARLATGNQDGDIRFSLEKLAGISGKICVTLGDAGAIGWTKDEGFVKAPSVASSVVDTMGAGDAFFAITALFAQRVKLKELLKIGNAAGALKAQIIGHERSVTREALEELLDAH